MKNNFLSKDGTFISLLRIPYLSFHFLFQMPTYGVTTRNKTTSKNNNTPHRGGSERNNSSRRPSTRKSKLSIQDAITELPKLYKRRKSNDAKKLFKKTLHSLISPLTIPQQKQFLIELNAKAAEKTAVIDMIEVVWEDSDTKFEIGGFTWFTVLKAIGAAAMLGLIGSGVGVGAADTFFKDDSKINAQMNSLRNRVMSHNAQGKYVNIDEVIKEEHNIVTAHRKTPVTVGTSVGALIGLLGTLYTSKKTNQLKTLLSKHNIGK